MTTPITVIVVDDSLLIRQLFKDMLDSAPDITVVGEASDPYEAREKIKQLNPDVITLDVEMPKMDGIAFLEKIMALRPMPVVMASTLTQKGAEVTLRALEIGAVDYVSKPQQGDPAALRELREELISKVRVAASAKVHAVPSVRKAARDAPATHTVPFKGDPEKAKLVAIGASTGGVEALREVIGAMPGNGPPVVITQHMPANFTYSFATRLNGISAPTVVEAQHGLVIKPGHVYIAPGSHHLKVARRSSRYICLLDDGEPVSGHRPSVDVLFFSIAEIVKTHVIGVILTGMGKDGAEGLLRLRQNGAITLGQDEGSSVIYGMPKAAYDRGAVTEQVALGAMTKKIMEYAV